MSLLSVLGDVINFKNRLLCFLALSNSRSYFLIAIHLTACFVKQSISGVTLDTIPALARNLSCAPYPNYWKQIRDCKTKKSKQNRLQAWSFLDCGSCFDSSEISLRFELVSNLIFFVSGYTCHYSP